jgi:hypothetical protein
MPQLETHRHELVAQGVVTGLSWTDAVEKAGYTAANRNVLQSRAHKLKQTPAIQQRVNELLEMKSVSMGKEAVASATEIDYLANGLWDRFTQAAPVLGPFGSGKIVCQCGEEHETQVWKFDGKNALATLDLRAKLAGLYVKNINVRHGKLNEIEGTLDQIWERIVNMTEPLGREFKEWIIARWGYEVVPANLRIVEGTAADVAEAPETAS